jgi:hypothetical protein
MDQDEGSLKEPDQEKGENALRCNPCVVGKMIGNVGPFMSESGGKISKSMGEGNGL